MPAWGGACTQLSSCCEFRCQTFRESEQIHEQTVILCKSIPAVGDYHTLDTAHVTGFVKVCPIWICRILRCISYPLCSINWIWEFYQVARTGIEVILPPCSLYICVNKWALIIYKIGVFLQLTFTLYQDSALSCSIRTEFSAMLA